ncbi:DUF3251 domain-containing protein [Erwinia psidii]|uniref:DUF3251 domain-containing protein n=1 Tax=Erwinia psidii TaxID=69224 RepID=A0A3N6S1M0_9GAMM|nr:DUF3251 domain-containing protein [Erwinia psidii]MCX8957973.1 DUF3251 domain-containing protein [Erwinia psidii]MCX8962629.1 DUF3251 domain-containing protein [Erwinia psidii]MCX8963952.1 DUF3251 domain-containing protein [Erwinia psidii]RQM39444.1 DUF3251 domain-containing protein [Erwinia psidii]
MTRVRIRKNLLLSVALLAGCASPPQQVDMDKLHNQIGQLKSEMQQLTVQTTALHQQNMLNSNSTEGAWLLPAADTPVLLNSAVGEIRLSLSQITASDRGSQATLKIRSVAATALPAFTAQVEWGECDPTTGKPLQINKQRQIVRADSTLQPQSEIAIPLLLSNTTPEQTGYLRVQGITMVARPQR